MVKYMEYKITLKKTIKHFHTVNKHRFKVFCLCCKVGIPLQGLLHDLSKYSPCEFWESVRYYQGTYSPIHNCKKNIGYSKAWLHHKGRNKHHYEYWYDYDSSTETPIIPFKYVVEMICDSFAAGQTYQGKRWNKKYQLSYWNQVKDNAIIDPKIKQLLQRVYKEVSRKGLDEVLNKKYLKELYDRYTK